VSKRKLKFQEMSLVKLAAVMAANPVPRLYDASAVMVKGLSFRGMVFSEFNKLVRDVGAKEPPLLTHVLVAGARA